MKWIMSDPSNQLRLIMLKFFMIYVESRDGWVLINVELPFIFTLFFYKDFS